MNNGRLSRDDSSSSTAASTLGASQEFATLVEQNDGVACEVKEESCDGDWLCQLQYRLYSRDEEQALLLKTYLQSRRPTSFRQSV